jgi:hydroxypyruvate reductase
MSKPGLLLWTENATSFLGAAVLDRFDVIELWREKEPDSVLDARGAEVVATLTWRMTAAQLDRLPNLRLIVAPGAGYDGIDVAAARARGVTVANAGATHSGIVADHAVALTLASIHRLPEMQGWLREGRWTKQDEPQPRRHAMSAQRFGIVGLGNIGTAVAERLAPFGGEIAWWSPREKAARWPRRESLIDLARWCTALIVATRGDAAGLIDAETIASVGPEGLIVNVSRGGVIAEDALISALKEGRLGYAALDVFVEEPTPPDRWRDVPNTLLTPHIGGVSYESLKRLGEAATRNLASVLDGTPVVNEVTA